MFALYIHYSAPVEEKSIAISLSVCPSVSPQAYLWNRWTDLHEILCADCGCMPFGHGFILLWWRYNTLCTSGFMDDVTFGRNGPYGDSGVAIPGRSLMFMNVSFLSYQKQLEQKRDKLVRRVFPDTVPVIS